MKRGSAVRLASTLAVLVASALVILVSATASGGDVVIADAYAEYFQRGKVKFDNVQRLLIAYRRSYERADPALAWVDADGRNGGRVSPLMEFEKGDGFDIWAVAAGPQSVLVSGIVQAGERTLRLPPRHVILTYDLAGTLRRKWAMNPWHVHEMAVDRDGNVYALGHGIDGHSANLIRKYSRDGVFENEFMPAGMFPHGENATSPESGDNQFWVEDGHLRVYMADSDDLFEFDLDGKLQNRASLHEPLARLAHEHGGVRAEIVTLTGDVEGSLLAQIRIWTQGDGELSFVLARLFLNGKRPQTLETSVGAELTTSFFPMLGSTRDDVLFLNRYTATILRR